jgi:mannose-6-phosphate isomerase-like protein (cupin superfamily)
MAFHNHVSDTFYVLEGRLPVPAESKQEVQLGVGESYAVAAGRPHLVTNAGDFHDDFGPAGRGRIRLRSARID